MKTTNVVLIVIGAFLALFVIAMTVVFCIKGAVPDALINGVMGGSGFEALLLAAIRISKIFGGNAGESEELS